MLKKAHVPSGAPAAWGARIRLPDCAWQAHDALVGPRGFECAMSEEAKPKFELPWGTLLPVLVLPGSLTLWRETFAPRLMSGCLVHEFSRPTKHSARSPRAGLGERVAQSARRSQDHLLARDCDRCLPALRPGPARDQPRRTRNHVQQLLEQAVPRGPRGRLHFLRSIATDDFVLRELIKELWLRRVPIGLVSKNTDFKAPKGPPPHRRAAFHRRGAPQDI